MTTLAIELNDSGILVGGVPDSRFLPDPGYALLEGKDLEVGLEAQSRARLKPRWVDNRYWVELDSAPMPRPFPRSLTRADVAHAHLARLWERICQEHGSVLPTSAILAIPGSFSTQQLSLILGIARACGIPVTGMVDAAVAAVSTGAANSRVLHLEATLHRLIWTEMVVEGDLVRRRVEVLETTGLAGIRDAWAKRIARLLVRRTRFDPFHHGAAEQTLYDLLPSWLQELADQGQVLAVLESDGKERSVELGPEDVAAVSESSLEPVVETARGLVGAGEPATFRLSTRAASIPGLIQRLASIPADGVITLDPSAAVRGALEHRQRIESPGAELPFVSRLPVDLDNVVPNSELAAEKVTFEQKSETDLPTHLLFEGTAHAITREVLWLGSAIPAPDRGLEVGGPMPGLSRRHCTVRRREGSVVVEDHSSFGTYLNDRRVEGRSAARIGDRIRLGSPGVELMFIAVADDHV